MSSPPPPMSAPPPGPPPSGIPPPPPPGAPPPPPPGSPGPGPSSITSANYFFGFVITFVVLLLLFVGCGIGSWRRFRIIGTAWDERLQSINGSPFSTRKRGRRRLIRPTFSELWTHPLAVSHLAVPLDASTKAKWEGVQPISAAFVWPRSTLAAWARTSNTQTAPTPAQGNAGSVVATLRSYVLPRRPLRVNPSKPPPVPRPPPESVQVAVIVAMPSVASRSLAVGQKWVGHPDVGEYQIGVVRIPWPSGEAP